MREETKFDIISNIYRVVSENTGWEEVLSSLSHEFKAESASLNFISNGELSARSTVGYDPTYQKSYQSYYHRLEPWIQHLENNPNRVFTVETIPGFSYTDWKGFQDTEFFDDWCKPQGVYWMLGGLCLADKNLHIKLGLQRPRNKGNWSLKEENSFEMFFPHFHRAIKLHQQLRLSSQVQWAFEQIFEDSTRGILLCDYKGKIVRLNPMAEAMLSKQGGLRLNQGCLESADHNANLRLHSLIQNAAETGSRKNTHAGGAVSLPNETGSLQAFVSPVFSNFEGLGLYKEGICAIVTLVDPDCVKLPNCQQLKTLFGLTNTESQLATKLAQGKTLAQISQDHQVSEQTARKQLKSVFAKTDTARQVDLIRMLMALPVSAY